MDKVVPIFGIRPGLRSKEEMRRYWAFARQSLEERLGSVNACGTNTMVFITFNNKKFPMLLESFYAKYQVPVYVLARNWHPWSWMAKIQTVFDFLRGVDNDYVCVTDADDFILLQHPRCIVERFEESKCDQLHAYSECGWPPNRQCQEFERAKYGQGIHLSSAYVGRRTAVIEHLRTVIAWNDASDPRCMRNGKFDDQLAWKNMHRELWPRIKVDSEKRIFGRFPYDFQ